MVISLDKHNIIFSVLLTIAVLACFTSVYSSNSQENTDYIICVDNIKFNTTYDSNINQFELYNDSDYDDGSYGKQYVDKNHVGYNIFIWNLSNSDEWDNFSSYVVETYDGDYYKTIDGVEIYNVTAGQGEHAGDQRFESYIINNDLKTIVKFSTPTVDETVKIAQSLEFM